MTNTDSTTWGEGEVSHDLSRGRQWIVTLLVLVTHENVRFADPSVRASLHDELELDTPDGPGLVQWGTAVATGQVRQDVLVEVEEHWTASDVASWVADRVPHGWALYGVHHAGHDGLELAGVKV